jgi:hypothetical protein
LTTEQIARLVFGGLASLSYARERLKLLWHAHLVERLFLHRCVVGSPLAVYALARHRPLRRHPFFLEHALALANVLIALHQHATLDHRVQVEEVRLDRELAQTPPRVWIDGQEVRVIPDAYVRLRLHQAGKDDERAWCLELDRATLPGSAFRVKVRRYLALATGASPAAFRTPGLTIVVVTTGGELRLRTLVEAVERELRVLGQEHHADLFRLASLPRTGEDPVALFTTPHFCVPLHPGPVRLLPELGA